MFPFVRRARTSNAAAFGNETAFRQETDRSASAHPPSLVEFERRTVGNPVREVLEDGLGAGVRTQRLPSKISRPSR